MFAQSGQGINRQIRLCGVKKMKNKTYRFAVAAALLLALALVFAAPVGAEATSLPDAVTC